MDHLQTRLEALEQRTHTVERQLRWWRGLACGLLVLALLTWALPVGHRARRTPSRREQGIWSSVWRPWSQAPAQALHRRRPIAEMRHHRGQPAHRQRPGQHRLHRRSRRPDSGLPERAGQPHRGLQRARAVRL